MYDTRITAIPACLVYNVDDAYLFIDPGDMIILYGNTPHKFFKTCASVSLATNTVGPLDLVRIMRLMDGWIIESIPYRTEEVKDIRLTVDGTTFGLREYWYERFNNCVFLGDSPLRSVLPLIWRALADGVGTHPSLRLALYGRQDEAHALDEFEGRLGAQHVVHEHDAKVWPACVIGNRWKHALIQLCGPLDSTAKPLHWEQVYIKSEKVRSYWLYPLQQWESPVFVQRVNKDRDYRNDKLTIRHGVDSEYTSVWSGMIRNNIEAWKLFVAEPSAAELRKEAADKSEQRDHGLHETQDLTIPPEYVDEERWYPDTGLRFLLAGAYIRYCKIAKKVGGQYSWSAKFAQPQPAAAKMPILPSFNLAWHRETFATTSANLFVGFHPHAVHVG